MPPATARHGNHPNRKDPTMAAQTRDDVLAEIERARNHNENPGLRDWNLTGADLSNLDLTDADLHLTNLRGANLTNVNLTDADLHLTDLRGANLTGTNLTRAWHRTSCHSTEQLLDTHGLDPASGLHLGPQAWDDLLPADPATRDITTRLLLEGWEGTLREAINHAHHITPADPDAHRLLLTLLQDWDGTVQEAIAAAETLHSA